MNSRRQLNIALIGQAFMGRAHSNGWRQAAKFFDLPIEPVLHTVCGRDAKALAAFAPHWEYINYTTDWREAVADPEIDLVDIGTPNNLHLPMAKAALEAGKHVACEKPLAGTLDDARQMLQAARKANKKCRTFVWYNYRRIPAVALAYQLVKAGKLGDIRQIRARYLQDWGGPDVPLTWRFDKKLAGSGVQGDLSAHIVDMMRFITGQEVTEICGAITETFIKERKLLGNRAGGGIAAGLKSQARTGKVTVDDAVLFLTRFSGGAIASFEATRVAYGNQNNHGFEINGTKGSLRFGFERMNELEFYDATAPRQVQGWTNIMCTHGGDHPYASAWWPDAHVLGYEHTFANMSADIVLALAGKKPLVPLPDIADAYQTQRVLEAAMISADEQRWIRMSEVK